MRFTKCRLMVSTCYLLPRVVRLVAVDAQGKIWAISGSTATRYNADGTGTGCRINSIPTATGSRSLGPLYTYSDMTGMQLLTITLRAGRWSVRINGQHPDVIWDRVDWSGVFPPGTLADVRVRTAPSPDRLSAAAWSGRSAESPYVIPPINIQSGFTLPTSG